MVCVLYGPSIRSGTSAPGFGWCARPRLLSVEPYVVDMGLETLRATGVAVASPPVRQAAAAVPAGVQQRNPPGPPDGGASAGVELLVGMPA